MIHPEAAIMRLEWLQLNVVRERFQMAPNRRPISSLSQLGHRLVPLLNHTPLFALGINREFHFRLESEAQWRLSVTV